ncbi:polysaccharide biosynthesis/export family protein [Thalassorhabdomicrobium marinisediminis]|uniref:polysaccharide biosynthesis/export family protein n=1 Tax=Thalassorhabdomicrobium marinisediminis TaxID=2170577 RepID=UPI002492A891|nr:polysaccharide biosynthesis/export family protein [Thalassorhabdomicrobium marinisediminis]
MTLKRNIFVTAVVLALSGCGAVYTSPKVLQTAADASLVRVVPVTRETVLQANRSAYQPRTLPALFSATTEGSGALTGAGALPIPPLEAQSPPTTMQLRPPPQVNPGPYEIGVGDVLIISTPTSGSTVAELSGLIAAQNRRQGYTVQDDGAIAIPDIGRIPVAGLTLAAAEEEVFDQLVRSQVEPSFSIEVAEFNSQRVSVGGGVARPAVVPITLIPLTLEQALAAAGGITVADQDFASVRLYRDGTLYQIPLTELYASDQYLNTRLLPGDSIFVDISYDLDRAQAYFAQQLSLVNARQTARSQALTQLQTEISLRRAQANEARENYRFRSESGAITRDHVYIAGEVGSQTRYTLPFEQKATLADALFDGANGVPLQTGDLSEVYILRASQDPREFGAVTAWHLNAENAANLVLAAQLELRPDDIIFVAEQPVTRWNRVIQQITPSLINTGVGAVTN